MARPRPLDIKLALEITTPAFLGGAEPRHVDPYLPVRPSAVRGALRTWFRAAVAALMPVADKSAEKRMLDRLYEAESCVFGSTKQRSAVIVLPPAGIGPQHIKKYGRALPDDRQWPGCTSLLRHSRRTSSFC